MEDEKEIPPAETEQPAQSVIEEPAAELETPEEEKPANEEPETKEGEDVKDKEEVEFKVGDAVTFEEGGQELHGTVESIQIKANLVDVKIYEPGHRKHCLITAVHPEALTLDTKSKKSKSA